MSIEKKTDSNISIPSPAKQTSVATRDSNQIPNRSTIDNFDSPTIAPSRLILPTDCEVGPGSGADKYLDSRTSATLKVRRRRSLTQSELTSVLYSPNKLNQNGITQTFLEPFQSNDTEGKVPSWESTLERSIKAIVSISANAVRSFDTETSGTYTATGFVIDAKEGLILSNRHVVNPGPIVAQATFTNYEEVDLIPVYRDPVHDFGIFKFDSSKIKFLELQEIKLAPHKAKVGMEIRVVGNDAGEKLSILSGTLARLDRQAPNYGVGRYNDFNTFYLQAASSTSGGSSGSPVLDIYGDAVALNAGGSQKAASSFYLPLDRVVRAIGYIRKGLDVPRGTLQTEFVCESYDALRRLGLHAEIEKGMRSKFPEKTGMLTVQDVLAKGPGDGHLQAGDILVAVNGNPVVDFFDLFEVIDDSVGKPINLTIWRNRRAYNITCDVQDLHSITPNKFVEVGGGVFHELSYQLAHSYCLPVQGVYVATAGYMFSTIGVYRESVILSINNQKTPDLESFYQAISNLTDGARVPVRFFTLGLYYLEQVRVMNVNCHWHSFRLAKCNNQTGLWDYTDIPLPSPHSKEIEPQTATIQRLNKNLKPATYIWPSTVVIEFYMPESIGGSTSAAYGGPGLVLDNKKGLVLCDRDSVFASLGDVYVTFGDSVVIPAKILYIHPIYCYVIIKYDPKLLGDTKVESAKLHPEYLSGEKRLRPGDQTYLVGVSDDGINPIVRSTHVASRSLIRTRELRPPRWRTLNCEEIRFNDEPRTMGGVLSDDQGRITGLWVRVITQDSEGNEESFATGIDISLVKPVLEALQRDEEEEPLVLRHMDIGLGTIPISSTRSLGLSTERIHQVEESDDDDDEDNVQMYYVRSILDPESEAGKMFRSGDVLLEINGNFIKNITDVAILSDKEKQVQITLLRDGEEMTLTVPTTPLYGIDVDRIICWAGATFQNAFMGVREQLRTLPSNVYVSSTCYGSPSDRYDIRPNTFVTEVDGKPVKTLDDLYSIVSEKRHGDGDSGCGGSDNDEEDESDRDNLRVTLVNMFQKTYVVSVKVDEHYFPLSQFVRDPSTVCGWKRVR